jgi:gamma-glutamylcyclotransferase (GGCT)/AIG2-like uncharacterized protein YtfP
MSGHYYFAYGSNLHPLRLRLRAPGARALGPARLRRYSLRFHKLGRDGSGKCDASYTGCRTDLVHGVVYRVARRDLRTLDRAEDAGRGYRCERVTVDFGGRRRLVVTYTALPAAIRAGRFPFDWYLGFVARGARHHGLPGAYVSVLEGSSAVRDSHRGRTHHHLRIMRIGAPPYRRR